MLTLHSIEREETPDFEVDDTLYQSDVHGRLYKYRLREARHIVTKRTGTQVWLLGLELVTSS